MDRARPRVLVLTSHLDPSRVRKPLAAFAWEVAPSSTRAHEEDASGSGRVGSPLPTSPQPRTRRGARPEFLSAANAVADIKDGSWLVVSGWW